MKSCKYLFVSVATVCSVAAVAQGQSALQFNGSSQYVTMGAATSTLGTATFTLECWFKRTSASGAAGLGTVTGGNGFNGSIIPLVSKGRGEADGTNVDCNYIMGLHTTSNLLVADFEEGPGGALLGLNHPVCGSTAIADTNWHHAAATYSAAAGWSLYLDGVAQSVATACSNCQTTSPNNCTTTPGATPRSDSIQHFGIASALTSGGVADGFFAGTIDEVRVWNVIRDQAQIQGAMTQQLTSGTGLIGRWGFNEGSGTTAGNSIAGSPAGTLTNSPTWVSGPPALNNQSPNQPTLVAPANGASGQSTSPTLTVNVTDSESNPMTVTFFGRVNTIPPPGPDFTIIALPDTQFYACGAPCSSDNAILTTQLQWIVDNRASRNIAFVTQLGDCVEHGNDGNVNGANAEWDVANAGYSLIESFANTGLTHGIPFGIAVGNHDQTPINSPRSGGDEGATTVRYNNTFGVNRFTGRTYYGGRYDFGAPATYPNNNDNHYELFSASGLDFIIIHLEYDDAANATRTAVIAWANGLLQTYSNRRGIVVSHYIVNPSNASFGPQGQAIYDGLKTNPNLFLMLSGHLDQANNRSDTFSGNTVNSLVSDYQTLTTGGRGWMRRMIFSPASNTIHVETFSPWANYPNLPKQEQLINSHADNTAGTAKNDFLLSYTMSGSPPAFTQIGSPVTGVASGSNASVVWSGLSTNTTHEWKVTVTDGTSTTNGPTWNFMTQCTGDAACDDGNPCTTDTCFSGACVHTNNSNSCNDGLACTTNDVCSAGVCAGTPVTCAPGATCNPSNGQCEFAPVTVTFQQGVSGYTGTVDTFINQGAPTSGNPTTTPLVVDLLNAGGINQALLRFDNIFGSGAGQIPPGATIQSATLTVDVTNDNPTAPATMNRMLQSWTDADTWNSRVNGIQTDGTEAATTPDVASLVLSLPLGLHAITVTNSLQTWNASPSSNRGWAFIPSATTDDGLAFSSSEAGVAANRPKLSVTYLPAPPCNVNADCNDNNACTADSCNAGTCQYTAISCDDGNACTTDTCNPATGCVHTAISCDDNNICTDDGCNPASGCTHTPVNCDDGNSCTTDSCEPPNSAAVSLNGASQYVSLGTGSAVTNFGTGSFTIEGWVRLAANAGGTNTSLFRMGRSGAFSQANVQILANSNTIAASVETNVTSPTTQVDTATGIAIPLNAWTHFAAVADRTPGNQHLRLYVNGVLVNDVVATLWNTNAISTTDASLLGATRADTGSLSAFLNGALDEVRLWNTARTQAEIQASMNTQLTSSSGLIARWGLNQGTGTNAADSVGTNHGTLTGGATWLTSGLVNLGAGGCVHTPINCSDSDPCTIDSCVNGVCQHVSSCDDGNPCTVDSCAPVNTAAVNMAVGQYVNLGAGAAVANFGTGSFTFEGWFRAAATSASQMSLFRMGRSGDNPVATIQIQANTTTLVASVESNSSPTQSDTTPAAPFTLNTWTHFAVVADRTTVGNQRLKLYVNGALVSDVGPATWGTNAISSSDATVLGANRDSAGVLAATYNGAIDEVRIWNTARTLAQIQANMNAQLTSANGLIARWGMNEGTGTSAADSVGTNTGTLVSGATWITSGLAAIGGGCVNTPVANGTACSDGNVCNGNETCQNGACAAGTPLDCNDGDPCTDDSCHPLNGCQHINNVNSCDDGNACTTGDTCAGGSCVGTPMVCNDNNPCTTDTCVNGVCHYTNNTSACNDGDPCTINDTCSDGACIGTPMVCNDGNPCTTDVCNGGICVYNYISSPCDDGDPCTVNDVCGGGTCAGTALNCNDNNPCTDDSCVNGACVHSANTDACNDGNACTENDVCSNSVCAGVPIEDCCNTSAECNDDNPCTDDACVNHACQNTPNANSCDDGNACTDDDVCGNSVCTGTIVQDCCNTDSQCDDKNPCTDDACMNHACQNTPNANSCDDGNSCTNNDVCDDGDCVGMPVSECCNLDAECDDNNACTDDTCSNHECQHVDNAAACDDGNACTTGDTCSGGSCVGTPVVCNDNNPCTDDSCVNGNCVYAQNTATCDDGNACTENDACSGGACEGTALDCNDSNACTDDSCNSQTGCVHTVHNCDDGNPCTTDTCNPGSGCIHTPLNCDDGDPCTVDSCVNGSCVHSSISPCYQLSLNVVGNTQICAGDLLDVALNAAGLQEPVNGIQALFQYDPARLTLNSISVGDGLSSPWNQAIPTYFSNTGGSVVYALVLIGAGTSADARVATLHFTALNPGSNSSPTSVTFRPDQGEFHTKITTSTNVVILPSKVDAAPVTVGPQIQVNLQVQGLTHAVTRDVTFVFTDCQNQISPQAVTRPVAFNASGMGSILLTGVGAGAEWVSASEGHTLSRRLPLSFGGSCFTSVGFTGANQLVAGDLHTVGVPQDNLVDIVDFAILFSRFNTIVSDCRSGLPRDCSFGADVNGDGVQETADFQAIQINFFQVGDDIQGCPNFVLPPGASKPDIQKKQFGKEAKSFVLITDLNGRIPNLARADVNGDGRIDPADVRAFAAQNKLPLLPTFEIKLRQLEGTAVAP